MRQEINTMNKRKMGIKFSGQDLGDILKAIYDTQEKDTKQQRTTPLTYWVSFASYLFSQSLSYTYLRQGLQQYG